MARKPKAPEQDNMPAVTDADILPESQPPGRTEAPPFEVDKQPLDLTLEEEVTLEQEGSRFAHTAFLVRDGDNITVTHLVFLPSNSFSRPFQMK